MIKSFLAKFSSLEEKLFLSLMIIMGLFPVLPNKLKPLPVVILILITIWILMKSPKRKIKTGSILYPIILSSLLIIYAVSLLYTDNLRIGFKRLETGASLFIVPWAFYHLSERISWKKEHLKALLHTYFWSAVVYAVIIIIFFYSIGYYRGEQTLEYCLSWLDGMLWGLSQHAIYASMIISIAALMIPYIYQDYKGWKKILLALGGILLIYILFLMFRKGVIIAISLSALIFLMKHWRKIGLVRIGLITTVLLIAGFLVKDKIAERVIEMFSVDTYAQVDVDKSTSMRFTVYNCVIDDIKKSPLIGHGIGDGYELIETCLEEKHGIVFHDSKLRKNSHNQYLGIWLYCGLIGLGLFLIQLFLYFKKAVSTKNLFFIQLTLFFTVVLFTENILNRQTGVLLFALFLNLFFFMQLATDSKAAQND
ncbi:MAG: O-antigen ligase family protein [Nonlabens sp.]|uniref:O-antigen ligase family protein n=1 Tax=Nonlabens sp. TaxID=1888209 RepID=UPI003EF81EAE